VKEDMMLTFMAQVVIGKDDFLVEQRFIQ